MIRDVMRVCGREFKYQCDTGSRSTLHVSRNCFAITHKRDRPRQPYRPVRRDFDAHLAAGHLHGDGAGAAAGTDGRLNTLIYTSPATGWDRPKSATIAPWTRPVAPPKVLGAATQRLRPGDEPERASVHRHLRWRGRWRTWRGVNASNRRISRRQSSAGRADKRNTRSNSSPRWDNQPHDKSGVPVGVIQILTRGHCCT